MCVRACVRACVPCVNACMHASEYVRTVCIKVREGGGGWKEGGERGNARYGPSACHGAVGEFQPQT